MAVVETSSNKSKTYLESGEDFSRTYRRRQLIEATIATIAEHGLSKVTLAKVASCAKLSPGIVNFYFTSKEQLLLETLKELAVEFDEHVQQLLSNKQVPDQTLLELIEAYFDPKVFTATKVAAWSAFWGESKARTDYLSICGEKDIELHNRIHDLFVELGKRQVHSDLDTRAAARGFEGILDGYWQDLLHDSENFDTEQAKQTCRAYLRNLFPNHFQKTDHQSHSEVVPLRTLMAPWTYTNAEFFDLEVESLFKRNWLLAGHISELSKTGDFITFDGLGERAIVVRGEDDELRAFHNVCQHRGSRVVRGERGNCKKAIVCPFHGWTYHLDGRLKNIPAINTFTQVDKQTHGLVSLDIEIWHGFIFIRFGGNGPSLAEMMAPMEEQVAPYKLEQMQPFTDVRKELHKVNWKVVHDIDNEGYHVPIGHPGLHELFGRDYFDKAMENVTCSFGRIQDKPAKQWSVARYQNLLPNYDHLPKDAQRLWFYVPVFPNLVFAIYPDSAEYYMTLPVSPSETWFIGRSFMFPDNRREAQAAAYLNLRINRQVGFEDWSYIDWLQEGMSSSAFPKGTLSELEAGVSDFHQEIQKLLPAGRLENEPVPGTLARINQSMRV